MNHYKWLKKNLPIFFKNLGLDIPYCDSLITAHGDKICGYKMKFEKNGLHFYHGCAIYLITSISPYSKEVRETENGWVSVDEWIINNKERFLPYLPEVI